MPSGVNKYLYNNKDKGDKLMLSYNPENQSYSKLIHIDELPEMQKKIEQIAERVKNAPVFPATNQDYDKEIYINSSRRMQ